MLLPLPGVVASSIPTIQWPLGPSSYPPLYYEPLEALVEKRPATGAPIDIIAQDVTGAVSLLAPPDEGTAAEARRHRAATSVALLLLGDGLADEAHDLVTPLSWPEETHFGHGRPVYSTAPPEVVAEASYVHQLVHRREGFNVGEYGMIGFGNANYWANAAMKFRGSESLPMRAVREGVLRVAEGNADAEAWCQERVVAEGGADDSYWEPRALHELCAQVSRPGGDTPTQLKEFAEKAAEVELRVMLAHCLKGAGYDCGDCGVVGQSFETEQPHSFEINESAALVAGKRLSSAHLNSFRTSNSVTLRGVAPTSPIGSVEPSVARSASAGIAARVLEAPAVRIAGNSDAAADTVGIYLPVNEEDAAISSQAIASAGGGSLSPGDVFASICSTGGNEGTHFRFVACRIDDSNAVFIDRLYGSRGETPTTVVQWSKGTIF